MEACKRGAEIAKASVGFSGDEQKDDLRREWSGQTDRTEINADELLIDEEGEKNKKQSSPVGKIHPVSNALCCVRFFLVFLPACCEIPSPSSCSSPMAVSHLLFLICASISSSSSSCVSSKPPAVLIKPFERGWLLRSGSLHGYEQVGDGTTLCLPACHLFSLGLQRRWLLRLCEINLCFLEREPKRNSSASPLAGGVQGDVSWLLGDQSWPGKISLP